MTVHDRHEKKDPTYASTWLVTERPSRSLMLAVVGLFAWLAVPWGVLLGTTLQGQVILAVCLVFSLIALGICRIMIVQALRSWRSLWRVPASGSGDTGSERHLVTYSGTLPMKSAAVQILLIPASLALGFTVFAIIDVAIRT